MTSSSERRRLQNRISQRNHRTRIRNHIAQLEARLAATGGDTTSNSEINRADVDPSHGHIDVENKCSTPPLDRLEMWTSMGTPPPEEVQDCHFDWEGYVNDGPDGDIGYDLHDMWMNATNDASPMTLEKDESAEAIMQLPSPAVEETGAEDGRPESPGESIIRTAHDGHHARGTGKPAVGMSHHCTGYDWGSISRKRQWPLSTSNPRRSSPVRSWSQDAVGLEPGSDAAAPRPCSSMPHDSAPSMPNPCCGPHGMHGRPMRDSTPAKPPPDASPSMRSSRRASSCSSTTGIDGPSYVPRLSVIGPGRHRRPSPSTDTSRKPPVASSNHHRARLADGSSKAPTDRSVSTLSPMGMGYCPSCACQRFGKHGEQFVTLRIPRDFLAGCDDGGSWTEDGMR